VTLRKTIVLHFMKEGMPSFLSWLNKLDLQFLVTATHVHLSTVANRADSGTIDG